MATTLTECGGTWSHVGTRVEALAGLHAEGFLHDIGIQLTRTRQFACQLAQDVLAFSNAAYHILDKGLTLLDDEHLITLVNQTAHQLLRQRILRNLQDGVGASVGETLVDIVEADTAGQDAELLVGSFYIFIIR